MSTWRERFAIGNGIYLLSHSVGRPVRDVEAELSGGFFDAWVQGDGEPWGAWLALIERFRTLLAGLLNTRPAQLCPQTNLSGGLTKLLGGLPRVPGRDVLLLNEQDFPTMGFVLEQAERLGYRRRFLPADFDPLDADAWAAQFAGEVRLVLVTHVQSNTGRRVPVAEIVSAARERGVLSVVDVAQSAGVVPIDLAAWPADFVLGSCVKWLCGGPGAGWLWASEEMLRASAPLDVGWFSHAEPFEFDIHRFRYAEDARRFWGGTPSVLPFAAASASIAVLAGIGIEQVQSHNRALGQRLIDALPAQCLRSPVEPAQRGGTLIVQLGDRQDAFEQRLRAAQVQFDRRATGVRLSPHVYNTQQEIDAVLECLREALQ